MFSVRFNGHFSGEHGQAGTRISPFWILLELRVTEVVSGDNWSYKTCKAPVRPTNQHPVFYRTNALPIAQPTVSDHWMKKSAQRERRKLCTLAVVRRSQKFSPRRRPPSWGRRMPKFNQLEMVTTFTYTPSLVRIDGHNFKLSAISSYHGNRPTNTNKQTHRQDQLQYTAPLSLTCSVMRILSILSTCRISVDHRDDTPKRWPDCFEWRAKFAGEKLEKNDKQNTGNSWLINPLKLTRSTGAVPVVDKY